jgi:hypothetical protein
VGGEEGDEGGVAVGEVPALRAQAGRPGALDVAGGVVDEEHR